MEQMKLTLRTLSPVVLSAPGDTTLLTSTRDAFSGTVLRGIIAAQYIEKRDLGTTAHEDADFRRLFFGGVRFVDAYPMTGDVAAFPLPASLQKEKSGGTIKDLFFDDPKTGFKSFRGMGVQKGDTLSAVSPRKTMTLHMSRNGENPDGERSDNAERLSGKSENGHIFSYEALCEGQTFAGALIGERQDLESLREILGETWRSRAGRSKFVEYGEVSCEMGEVEPLAQVSVTPEENTVWLRLHTPLLPLSGDASCARDTLSSAVAEEMNRRTDGQFVIGKIFANTEPVDNFVSVWRLRRPRQMALAAGSCFALEKTSGAWDERDNDALSALMHEGAGLRPEEGFGQLRLWEKRAWRSTDEKGTGEPSKQRTVKNKTVREMAKAILLAKRLADVRSWAADDAKSAKNALAKQPAHVFVRLDSMLMEAQATKQDNLLRAFRVRLEKELSGNPTAFSDHLKELRVKLPGGKTESLKDILQSNPTEPYEARWANKEEDLREVYEDLEANGNIAAENNNVFWEYWHWFFRYGRKMKNGEEMDA